MQRVTLLLIARGRYGRLSVLTLLLPLLCWLILVSAVSAPPAVLADPGAEAASAKPRTFASYYRDATVFRDRNRNQAFDPGERYSVTGTDGRFDPPKGNGRLYLTGGTRIDTGEINTLTLTAPPQARAITTLTALWQALLDKRQSQAKITKMLGLARHTTVLDFQVALADDLGSASPKKKKIVRADAQNDTLVRFLQALSLGASRPRTIQSAVAAAPSGLGAIDALAQGLIKLKPKKPVDLTDQTTNQKIYVTAFSHLGTTLGPSELENLAEGTVRLNQMIAQDQLGIALATRACILSLLPETSFDIAFNYCLMPPPAPVVATALAAVSRNATPTLNGTADSRILTVRVYRNGVLVDTVPVVANAWSYTSPPLPDGRYLFEVKGINAAGVEGIPSAAMPTEIRTSPPAAPTVTPHTANSFTPTITGNWSGAAGDSLAVTINRKTYTSAPALTTSGSAWFLTIPASDALLRGTYDVIARDTDVAGNSSVDATTNELTIHVPYKALQVAAGGEQSCAILDDHSVKCWGANCLLGPGGCSPTGQLGLGDGNNRGDNPGEMGNSLPRVNLGTGRTAKALVIGSNHACAILDDDSVKCWGRNGSGQLGLGDTANRGDKPRGMGDDLPRVNLGTGRTAKTLTAGFSHTCAILDDDSVKCWGWNRSGQLGLGSTANRGDKPHQMGDNLPRVDLGSGRTARTLAAGSEHTCAILDDDSVKCWGRNFEGELGLEDSVFRGDDPGEMGDTLPRVNLGAGRTAKALAAGTSHTCAILDETSLKCWGSNSAGQLGLGDTITRGDQPGQMGDQLDAINPISAIGIGVPIPATAVAAGDTHTCALFFEQGFSSSGGTDHAECWGSNFSGQLGTGDTNALTAPDIDVDPGQGRRIVGLALGDDHTCALLDDGFIKCWGSNSKGELGLGDKLDRGNSGGSRSVADLSTVDLGG